MAYNQHLQAISYSKICAKIPSGGEVDKCFCTPQAGTPQTSLWDPLRPPPSS